MLKFEHLIFVDFPRALALFINCSANGSLSECSADVRQRLSAKAISDIAMRTAPVSRPIGIITSFYLAFCRAATQNKAAQRTKTAKNKNIP